VFGPSSVAGPGAGNTSPCLRSAASRAKDIEGLRREGHAMRLPGFHASCRNSQTRFLMSTSVQTAARAPRTGSRSAR
jgi:hypothetical protein